MKLCWPDGPPDAFDSAILFRRIFLRDECMLSTTGGDIVSPLFIQPTAIGSEYEDCTSFYLFRREVGLHKTYLISPYIGHKPSLSRMNIVVSAIKHLFKILILHWNYLLSKN